jgi:hypothetical protein
VRPSRTITAVDSALRISFWAVPAFIRVEPVMTSGPVSTATWMSAAGPSGASGLAEISTVCAPAARPARRAPPTYGVRPLALTPTTTSPARTPAAAVR